VDEVEISWCIVNTAQRERLRECLDAVAVEKASMPFRTEVLVLDNFSQDGSAEMAEGHSAVDRVIALPRRRGKAENDSELIGAAHGRYCLLLNEDAMLRPGATAALRDALDNDPLAAAAGARLLRPDGREQPAAWRFPGWRTAIAGALLLHRRYSVMSGGDGAARRVDWAQSAAMLVRRDAVEAIGRLDPGYFVYSDETDLCRRLADRGRPTLYVPDAVAVHHEGLSTGPSAQRRIVEFARGRDRYLRTHIGSLSARLMRPLIAFPYLLRALAATVLPGHDSERYMMHVRATLDPSEGEGLREAAAAFNRRESARAADAVQRSRD
jgi:GT2 family glycosyltransferase